MKATGRMSKYFTSLQQVFRRMRETNNVDLTHTHGVAIDDKVYPALEKAVHYYNIQVPPSNEPADNYFAGFSIPFENGMRAFIASDDTGRMEAFFNVPYIITPHVRGARKKSYGYIYIEHALDDDSRHLTHLSDYYADIGATPRRGKPTHNRLSPHEAIQKFSKLPSVGFNIPSFTAGSKNSKLSEQEFLEHKNNYQIKPHEFPNNVVYMYDHPAYDGYKKFDYNVVTEQLKERLDD
jgi:hypothetical protein